MRSSISGDHVVSRLLTGHLDLSRTQHLLFVRYPTIQPSPSFWKAGNRQPGREAVEAQRLKNALETLNRM
jgi:hypothetical protein